MIREGTDDVSQGRLCEGVTAGESMLSFIPMNENPLERSPQLKAWLQSWVGDSAGSLSPDGWFK
jgi:hypothetical protein